MTEVDPFAYGCVDDLTAEELVALFDAEPVDAWESDPSTLTPAGLSSALAQLQALRSRLAAREAEVLRALVGPSRRVRDVSVTDEEGQTRSFALIDEAVELAATAMHQSAATVRRRITVARALSRLPATRRALENAQITPEHADVIARTADGLPAHLVRAYDRRVVRRARVVTPSQTATFARRVRAGLNGPGEEIRRQEALRLVDVRIWAEDDGLACLQARLPLADAVRVHAALEARSHAVPFDSHESQGQRRARALVEAVCGSDTVSDAGRPASTPVALNVTIDIRSLLGLHVAPAEALVPGQGREPMTVDALRELLAQPETPVVLRRLVTDPLTGRVIDRGRAAYRVTDALRAFLVARDSTCRFPLCSRNAVDCDIDHVQPWADGGGTDADNLLPLCRRHHVLKTHGGWRILEQQADGTVVWSAPDGREIVSPPWTPVNAVPLDPAPPPRVRRAPVAPTSSDAPSGPDGFPF